MEYENYAEQIKPIIDFKSYPKPKADRKSVARISVKKGEMITHLVRKNKFHNLMINDFILFDFIYFTSFWSFNIK